jgi:uncharacterized protein YfaS (alpha-2-macroglobulin family)
MLHKIFLLWKKLVISALLITSGMAQNIGTKDIAMNKYLKEWTEIQILQQQGLPQSVLPKVETIYKSALEEKNYGQVIKATIFQLNCIGMLSDNDVAANKIFNTLKNDSEILPQPAKSIIYSMLGQMYEEYYNQNRWKINERTYTAIVQDDVKTFDARKLTEEAVKYYELSLKDAEVLRRTPIDEYKEILEGPYDVKSQPAIYDLLANRVLAYYASIFNTNSLPRQTFVINDTKYFADAKDFVKFDIQTFDTLSPDYLSLRTYQKLLLFYLDRTEYTEILINNDLRRMEFLRNKGRYPDSERLYEEALVEMSKCYAPNNHNTKVLYQLASYYHQKGTQWRDDKNANNKSGYLKAYELAERIKKDYPGEMDSIAESIIKSLKEKELDIRFESVQLPGKPFLSLVKFRNIDTLYQTVYKLSKKEALDYNFNVGRYNRDNNHYDVTDFIKTLESMPSTRKIEIPKTSDYQYYTTEIKIDPLEKGLYLVIFSDTAYPLESEVYNSTFLQISGLAATDRTIDGNMAVLITDRITGEPIQRAILTLNKIQSVSAKDGLARMKNKDAQYKNRAQYYEISYENDNLLVLNVGYNKTNYNENQKVINAAIFTDRAIYRPGQIVFFKAILYDNSINDKKELYKRNSVNIRFKDANEQIVGEQSLTTNDFGSVSGNFAIPQGLLNGHFTIECENYGRIAIRVEEYKRPTFEVKFDTIRENYKLNDNIKVVANAKALAGYAIDDAKVQYMVRRTVRHCTMRLWNPYYYDRREISSGVVETDVNGKAVITFQALADDVKNNELIYTYTITADVTDVNGETRTGTTEVNISNKPLLIKVNIPEKVNVEKLDNYTLETTNLNGDATPATIDAEIVALKSPEKILRQRLWSDAIDIRSIPENEFRRDFPFDEYNDELNPRNFAASNPIAKFVIDTEKNKKLDLSALKESGYYKLILKVQNQQCITVDDTVIFSFAGKKPEKISNMNDWLTVVKAIAEPGENTEFLLSGGNDTSYVHYEVIHKNELIESKWIKIGTVSTKIFFPIKEEYRGGVTAQFSMIQNNRIYQATKQIVVPFTNKMLDVKFATFRDKLLPGENEKWTMLVSNKNDEKEIAEIVVSLYDASLDAFVTHSWIDINSVYYQSANTYLYTWNSHSIGQMPYFETRRNTNFMYPDFRISYAGINWFDGTYKQAFRDYFLVNVMRVPGRSLEGAFAGRIASRTAEAKSLRKTDIVAFGAAADNGVDMKVRQKVAEEKESELQELNATLFEKEKKKESTPDLTNIQTRTNFNETVFFYPQLRTNEKGEILIEFTMPETLTQWNLLSFAHTKDFKIGTYTSEIVTQKQVAVSANPPRFFRENDEIELSAKVNNLTESDLKGKALLHLYDAVTMQPVNNIIVSDKTLSFGVKRDGSEGLKWKLKIPEGIQAITYKITAQAGTHSDGEEKIIPVLTNSMLITETMPFSVRAGQKKTFTMDKLLNGKSTTLRNHSLTLEYTSAPAWYAVQAMPYIMEYPYECAEQTFSRYYANSLATAIINKTPRIKQIFKTWKILNSDALLSNLEKNQELKNVILEEMPWVMQAKDETGNKKRIGLLFDLNRMSNELNRAFNKLKKAQDSDGGFPWFEGNPSSRYITQHIITGMAHLEKLGAMPEKNQSDALDIVSKGLTYLDREIWKDYDGLIRQKTDLKQKRISAIQLHYLYACSFKKHKPTSDNSKKAFNYYLSQTEKYWPEFSTCEKAMAALILCRFDSHTIAQKIIASLKEFAQHSEEMGMYWKDNVAGYFWHQAPIETQAILIEAFNEVAADMESVEEMKIWLLRNKQTNGWKTTKATSEAIYALLMSGNNLLDESKPLEMEIGGKPLEEMVIEPVNKPETGTGYVKTSWQGERIMPQMGNITVKNPNNMGIAWGGMYWQYFEQLDKITSTITNLKINKQLFIRVLTDKGEELEPVNESNKLHTGDLVRVRLELRADRDFEYVHLKDMRAAGFEPVSAISGHRYQDGLFYYESIKDASINFFIDYLRKGTCVLEYDLRVSHEGNFSNGITTFQCMYAPEFIAHSEGIRVKVE